MDMLVEDLRKCSGLLLQAADTIEKLREQEGAVRKLYSEMYGRKYSGTNAITAAERLGVK